MKRLLPLFFLLAGCGSVAVPDMTFPGVSVESAPVPPLPEHLSAERIQMPAGGAILNDVNGLTCTGTACAELFEALRSAGSDLPPELEAPRDDGLTSENRPESPSGDEVVLGQVREPECYLNLRDATMAANAYLATLDDPASVPYDYLENQYLSRVCAVEPEQEK